MNSKHFTRHGMEWLYSRLANELNIQHKKLSYISDYNLLSDINCMLCKLNCEVFSEAELEMDIN